jgi:hypothetical protein
MNISKRIGADGIDVFLPNSDPTVAVKQADGFGLAPGLQQVSMV